MSNNKIHFYAEAELLDRYIHSSDPQKDPNKLNELLEILRIRRDLRDYFFHSSPHASWAKILWEHDFFSEPPSPQETEYGNMLPYWDVQGYLISIADQAPDIVLKHIETVHGHPLYISRAIEALNFVPPADVERTVPRIVNWLKEPQIAETIALPTYELIKRLVKGDKSASAFDLFHWLTEPIVSSKTKQYGDFLTGTEAVSKLNDSYKEKKVLLEGVNILKEQDVQRTVTILEEHLITALRLEAEAKKRSEVEFESYWRVAIGETGQDSDYSYRDNLLRALRDALETWVDRNSKDTESLVKRYLEDKHEILRRIGLYILYRFPQEHKEYVAQELKNKENSEDINIHHEYFMLLQYGYSFLDPTDQKYMIETICQGPNKDKTAELAKFAQESWGADPEEYLKQYSKDWIRDRLWILKDNLSGKPLQLLNDLVTELGEPEHPAFIRWHSGAYTVQDVSPIDIGGLSKKSADELLKFIQKWKPPSEARFGPERISYEGLANDIASLVLENPQKYADKLVPIALCRSEFAVALLDQFTKSESASTLPWELCIELCEKLLENESIKRSMSREAGETWVWARRRIVNLLEEGIKNTERAIPLEYLPRVRDILLLLSDDPDPDFESDRPKEGWFGHEDPATVAINHIRPEALSNLILYALQRIKLIGKSGKDTIEGPGPQRLEDIVREKLSQKLDKRDDYSWAVHSIYGRHLWMLYWLDKDWVEANINKIFPEEETDENIKYYVAAWDSFVIFNPFNTAMIEMLYPKYARAANYISKGYKTETHFRPAENLSGHLIWEYLLSDKNIPAPSGELTLIEKFFQDAKSEYRGTACWVFWQILEDNRPDLDKYWQKARMFWEWRINRASMENNSTDFDGEMQWFSHFPLIAPPPETITSMWPLLEGLLPHIARDRYDTAWRSLERYLAKEVEEHPERSIQYYYLMHTQPEIPPYVQHGKEAQKIIETAVANETSRKKTLSLINVVASRFRNYKYREIYERYA